MYSKNSGRTDGLRQAGQVDFETITSAISWWVPPGEVDWGRGFVRNLGTCFSRLSLGPNEKPFVSGLWCFRFLSFFFFFG